MKIFSANDAKQSLGLLLDTAQSEPVLIRKHNRDAAIMISPKEYDRLRGINAAEFSEFCDRVGEKVARKGLTEAKLASLLA